jgi:hypothetical protein
MKQTALEFIEQHLLLDDNWRRIFQQAKEIEKQQKGYSEEEVLVLLHNRDAYNFKTNAKSLQEWETPKEWFEQFKNK